MKKGLNLFEFQDKAVKAILDLIVGGHQQSIVVKSPTGSGKTMMLISLICRYLDSVDSETAFIWLCPGKGDLEEQSKKKMNVYASDRHTQTLLEALRSGFSAGSTTFVNWELVTNKDNVALREGERKNLFDGIATAHRNGIRFIVVIDEEHSNDTAKAASIIDAFAAYKIIRMSATASKNRRADFYEIDELDVIYSGLITRAIYVNEGIPDNEHIHNDVDYLIEIADKKRTQLALRFKEIGRDINPLVLIQFPSARPDTIKAVEEKLYSLGYSYEHREISKWMSEVKSNTEGITQNDAEPLFLLMKQAISTGWDCPRAKILIKLREGMDQIFEIQTIGRIRRTPEACHYNDSILDYSYIYTFDETFKRGLLSSVDRSYITQRLFLKEECKEFSLTKQNRDLNYEGYDERILFDEIRKHFKSKYKLEEKRRDNIDYLKYGGYVLNDKLIHHTLQGEFIKTGDLSARSDYQTFFTDIDVKKENLSLLHCIDVIKTAVGISSRTVRNILERLFRKGNGNEAGVFLSLSLVEFYAFVINNEKLIRDDFKEVSSKIEKQGSFKVFVLESNWKIPEQDFYRYDPGVKNEELYRRNAYKEYTSGFATSLVRSTSEMLFEAFCESESAIKWIYKNGDSGKEYFSIVYMTGVGAQALFYPDYIVCMNSGKVWIIETKGGESKGENKNIDIQIANKFNALKKYASEHQVEWGFVRDKDGKLYINNTDYNDDMNDDVWKPIQNILH